MPAAVVERRVLGHGGKNWITATPGPGSELAGIGALPKYISFIAGALHRSGHDVSSSIAIAVGTVQRWARGEGKVSPIVRKRSAEALAEWEAKKAEAAAKSGAKRAVNASNGARVRTVDLTFNPKQQRAAAGTSTGGQWASEGGTAPTKQVQSPAYKSWAQRQVGHYPAGMTDPKQREAWDNWFKFFAASAAQQKALVKAGKAPKAHPKAKPPAPPIDTTGWAPMPTGFANGGSVTQLNFADVEPDADDMVAHVRASVPKGHGMKVPDGTEPAKVAKMHSYLHRQGNAKHSHSNGAMNYSQPVFTIDDLMRDYRHLGRGVELAAQRNAGTVKGVAGTSPGARKAAAAKGKAMPDGSFPVSSRALYDRARKALGRTNPAKRPRVRALLVRVAKRNGWPLPGGTDMSLPADGLYRALTFANLPHAQFPRVETNPKPAKGVGKAMATYRQPVTTTGKAGNEMFPPRARKTTGPATGRNIPYGTPKGTRPPPGGPQAPLRLPKGGYEGMQIYTPANPAEHSHVMRALRGARALRRQGRTAQANSVMAGLVRQVTGRARKMPNGQTRAHTIREVTTGLARMAKGVQGITKMGATGVKKGHG